MKSWAIRAGLVSGNYLSPEEELGTRKMHLESNMRWMADALHLSFGDKGLQSPPDDPAQWGGWSC